MQALSSLRSDKKVTESLSWFNRTPESDLFPVSEPFDYGQGSLALTSGAAAKLLDNFATGGAYSEFVKNTDTGDLYFVGNAHVYTLHGAEAVAQNTTIRKTSASNSVYSGGYLYYLKDLIVYRMSTTTWIEEEFTTLNTDVNASRIILHGDFIYILHTSDQRVHTTTGVVSANPMETPTATRGAPTIVIGDKAYLKISNAYEMEIYDFSNNTWERIVNTVLNGTGYWNTYYFPGTGGTMTVYGNKLIYTAVSLRYSASTQNSGYLKCFDMVDYTQLELKATYAAGRGMSGMAELIDCADSGAMYYDAAADLMYLWHHANPASTAQYDLYVVPADTLFTTNFMNIEG
jgi:hypothetical protein